MIDSQADLQAAVDPADGVATTPAVLASRGARLPVWDRIEASSRKSRSRWVAVVAWCVALALLVVALLRVTAHDATVALVWVNAFTLYVYLPVYGVLAFAVWQRRWWLAAASGAVVACHLAWVAPDYYSATPLVPPSATATDTPQSVRVFYVNIRNGNREIAAMIDEAVGSDADVIIFAEMDRAWVRAFAESEALKPYRFGTPLLHRHPGDINVHSRLPVRQLQIIKSQSRVCVVVDVALGSESLRLFCLHSPRPLIDGENLYSLFWQEIEPILAEQPEPLVVIGDFNATQHSLVYGQLTSGRLRSAHADRGRGYATTWPNGVMPFPPIRIDQAFLSPQVECVSIVEGVGSGSDHKPLILELRVYPTGPLRPTR